MSWFRKSKSLSQKLIDIVAEMPRLTKNGHRADFSYLQISDLANAFYGRAKTAGVVVIPDDLECTLTADSALVKTRFTIFDDGDEEFIVCSYGFAREDGKWGALPIAQTMALKALLKRLGMTFGEEDDAEFVPEAKGMPMAEWDGEKFSVEEAKQLNREMSAYPSEKSLEDLGRPDLAEKLREQESVPAETENPALVISEADGRLFARECRTHQKDLAMRRDWLKVTFGTWDIRELPNQEAFEKAMAWARGKEDLAETLEKSIEAVKQGPQPVVAITEAETVPFAKQF